MGKREKATKTDPPAKGGPPQKKRKTVKEPKTKAQEATPISAKSTRGLPAKHFPNALERRYLEFPTPPNKNLREWPRISFGEYAPKPRWIIVKDTTSPETGGRDLEADLIRVRPGRTIIKGLGPDAHPRSFDTSIGLGAVTWKFEGGASSAWKKLTEAQIHEFAFRSLERTLDNPNYREQIRESIRQGCYSHELRHVEDPLPPIPKAPPESEFGKENGLAAISADPGKLTDIHRYWPKSNVRPSLGIKLHWNTDSRPPLDPVVERMFHHMKGTLGPPDVISGSYESEESEYSVSSSSSLSPARSLEDPMEEEDESNDDAPAKKKNRSSGSTKKKIKNRAKKSGGKGAHVDQGKTNPNPTLPEPPTSSPLMEFLALQDMETSSTHSFHDDDDSTTPEVERYFLFPKMVRRMRSWAGSKMPPAVAQQTSTILPRWPSSRRPLDSVGRSRAP